MTLSPRVVVLGSINMDLVVRCARLPARGETVIAESSLEIPGGKGANQAVAAARAGGDVQMIGRVGDDAFGMTLIDQLKRQQVDVAQVAVVDQCASGIAVVAVELSGENSIMVVPGANGTITSTDVEQASDLIRGAEVLLLQLEIPIDAVLQAIEIAKQAGVRVILDPAPMPVPFPQALFAANLICPNQSEAASMVGFKVATIDDAKQAVSQLHSQGAGQVIITMGDQGAVVSDGRETRTVDPIQISPVDTTAAGDAFAGALAVRLAEGASLWDAAEFANTAGALAATQMGAQPAMPSRKLIESFPTIDSSFSRENL